jgi:hypothetical protein
MWRFCGPLLLRRVAQRNAEGDRRKSPFLQRVSGLGCAMSRGLAFGGEGGGAPEGEFDL